MTATSDMRHPGIAAVLSLVIPGVGQIYNGDFLRGIFWLIVTPGLWIGTGGLLGWICHVIAAFTAHRRAHDKNQPRGSGGYHGAVPLAGCPVSAWRAPRAEGFA